MDPVTLRAVERILAVIIGGLCIYLGYSLFLHLPEQKQGEGQVKLPGGMSIIVTRVGPGVFFALFGAVVVTLSFLKPVFWSNGTIQGVRSQMYGGLTPPSHSTSDQEKLDLVRLRLRLEVEFLNTLPSMLRADLSEEQQRECKTRIVSTKFALIKTVWGPDWGDFDNFKLWVESGALDPVPDRFAAPAAYYRSGQEVAQ